MADLIQKDIRTLVNELGMLEELTNGYALLTQKADGSEITMPVSPGIAYSTTEKATPSKWIDGKTIYRKTIYFGQLPTPNSQIDIAHGISNFLMAVNVSAIAHMTTSPYTSFLIPRADFTASNTIKFFFNNTNLSIATTTSGDWSSYRAYITLHYIKTT